MELEKGSLEKITNESKSLKRTSSIPKVNKPVFLGAAIFCALFYAPTLIFREQMQPIGSAIVNVITHRLDWAFLLLAFACFIFAIWLAFGRYAHVKLGGADDEPEFKRFTWVAMIFTGGVGAGLVHWSMAEPISYLMAPPFLAEPLSAEAAGWSLAYGIFHWGILAWGLFVPASITFAYMIYVKKIPYFSPAYACRGVLGDIVNGWAGKAINIFVIIGIVGAMGASIGVAVPMISEVAANLIGIENSLLFKGATLVILGLIFTYTVWSGMQKGIKKFSEINTWLCFALLAFILATGPTLWILSFYIENLGMVIQNFLQMAFSTDPIRREGFPQRWTVFYWAWWLAFSMYFGLFIARISRGRTIREVVLNMTLATTLGCSIFFMIFGGYAVNLQLNEGVDLVGILAASGTAPMIATVLNTLPFAVLVIPYWLVVVFFFKAIAIDANTYTVAMISCKKIKYKQEPPKWTRLFWCLMVCSVGFGIISVGGLQIVRLSVVATSLPLLFITIILMMTLVKWLKEDFGDITQPNALVVDYEEDE